MIDHIYKVGERIKTHSGFEGVIKAAVGHYSDGTPIYSVDFDHNWMGTDIIRQTEILAVINTTKPNPINDIKKCECGACYTSFPNIHSKWCPEEGK